MPTLAGEQSAGRAQPSPGGALCQATLAPSPWRSRAPGSRKSGHRCPPMCPAKRSGPGALRRLEPAASRAPGSPLPPQRLRVMRLLGELSQHESDKQSRRTNYVLVQGRQLHRCTVDSLRARLSTLFCACRQRAINVRMEALHILADSPAYHIGLFACRVGTPGTRTRPGKPSRAPASPGLRCSVPALPAGRHSTSAATTSAHPGTGCSHVRRVQPPQCAGQQRGLPQCPHPPSRQI